MPTMVERVRARVEALAKLIGVLAAPIAGRGRGRPGRASASATPWTSSRPGASRSCSRRRRARSRADARPVSSSSSGRSGSRRGPRSRWRPPSASSWPTSSSSSRTTRSSRTRRIPREPAPCGRAEALPDERPPRAATPREVARRRPYSAPWSSSPRRLSPGARGAPGAAAKPAPAGAAGGAPPARRRRSCRTLAQAAGVAVEEIPADALARLAPGARTQGLVLEAGPLPTVELAALFGLGSAGSRCLVALDGIEDPQNVGALLRAADAAGATGPLSRSATRRPSARWSPARAPGRSSTCPSPGCVNLARALVRAKEKASGCSPSTRRTARTLFGVPDRVLAGDLVVVVGGEDQGVRHGIRRLADHRLTIPMRGHVASLNVAAAAAVALFEWARRRSPPGGPRAPRGVLETACRARSCALCSRTPRRLA